MRARLRLALPVLLWLVAAGARGDDDLAARAERTYTIETARSPATLAVGARGSIVLAIRCNEPGVHVQTQAPLKVTATATPGLALTKDRLGWKDAHGPPEALELELAVTASKPGPQEARVRLDFYLCSRSWCVRQEREVVVPVTVETAAASQPAPPRAEPVRPAPAAATGT
jgi:hypothetical protein